MTHYRATGTLDNDRKQTPWERAVETSGLSNNPALDTHAHRAAVIQQQQIQAAPCPRGTQCTEKNKCPACDLAQQAHDNMLAREKVCLAKRQADAARIAEAETGDWLTSRKRSPAHQAAVEAIEMTFLGKRKSPGRRHDPVPVPTDDKGETLRREQKAASEHLSDMEVDDVF